MVYYIPITLLLSLIEFFRIKIQWGKVININHWESYLFGAIGMAGAYFLARPEGWHIATFIVGCMAIRGLLYDIVLNILVNFFITPRSLDFISNSSNSLSEDRLTHVSFWERRLIAFVFLAACIAANYFIK